MVLGHSCIQWFKDTNLKANHNWNMQASLSDSAVFNGSKILIWKQITTHLYMRRILFGCIQWFKDTNLKANHNHVSEGLGRSYAVFNGSKILIWKQITTPAIWKNMLSCCIQWFKDTNLKANHNPSWYLYPQRCAVFNGSKILIWKQITTIPRIRTILSSCIQWFKDTNLKANHNAPS